jgi:hypothetical protein
MAILGLLRSIASSLRRALPGPPVRSPSLNTAPPRRFAARRGRSPAVLGAFCVAAGLLGSAGDAHADPFVERRQVLRMFNARFEAGGGLGQYQSPLQPDVRGGGTGASLSGAVGLPLLGELGARFGFRGGGDGRLARADYFARPFDTETYGTRFDATANPEISLRSHLVDLRVLELVFETRYYIPIEEGARFGFMPAIPVSIHLSRVRIDSGVYVPLVFRDPFGAAWSVPAHVWVQVNDDFYVGVLSGVRHRFAGPVYPELSPVNARTATPVPPPGASSLLPEDYEQVDIPFGFGAGYSLTSFLDVKAQLLSTRVNGDKLGRNLGFGLGVELRLE